MRANPDLKTYTRAQLNDKIQNLSGFIENITDSELVVSQSINDNAKTQFEKTGLIIREDSLGNATMHRITWEKHISEVNGDKTVLKIAKQVCQQILENYTTESARRNDKKKISQLIGKMVDLAKEAEKIKPSIRRANEQAEKSFAKGRQTDIKTASAYIDATTKFNDLSDQYSNLKNELRFYTNEALNITEFPGLASTDISADHNIQKTWQRGSA